MLQAIESILAEKSVIVRIEASYLARWSTQARQSGYSSSSFDLPPWNGHNSISSWLISNGTERCRKYGLDF